MSIRTAPDHSLPGAWALGLITDSRNARILSALAVEPLNLKQLTRRIDCPRSTLSDRLSDLAHAGAIRREGRGPRSGGVVNHLEPLGRELVGLLDLIADGAAGAGGGPTDRPPAAVGAIRGVLGSGAPELLAILDSPHGKAALERMVDGITRSQIEYRLDTLVGQGLVEELGGRFMIAAAGRRASILVGLAADLERRLAIPGVAEVRPAHAVMLLLVVVPLLDVAWPKGLSAELHVVEGDEAAVARVVEAGGRLSATVAAGGPAAVRVRGSIDDWREAVVAGRPGALHHTGQSKLGIALVRALHELVPSPAKSR